MCDGFESKFHAAAHKFIREDLDNRQRKILGALMQHTDGIDGIEDELPGALHDQAHDGDDEAWRVLQGNKEVIDNYIV